VYSASAHEVSDEFKEKVGEYFDYSFIKESLLNLAKAQGMNFNIIGTIEEEDLPSRKSIDIKL
jgi:hypothetical protein